MTESINELMNDKGVCRTAPGTPGLLTIRRLQKAALSTSHQEVASQVNQFGSKCMFLASF